MKSPNRYTISRQAQWMWHASRGMKTQAVLNALCGVMLVGADFLSIYFTKQVVDIATGNSHGSFALAAAWLVAVMVLRIALGVSMRWIKAMLGVKAQNRMQSRLFHRMLMCRWQGRERHHSGDVLNRLEQDVRDVVNVITETLPQTIAVAVRLAGAFVFMAMMDWRLAVTVTLMLPLFILLSRMYVSRMRTLTRDVRQSDSKIQSLLQESVQHRIVIKTLQAIATVTTWLHEAQDTLLGQIRQRTIFATMSGLTVNIGFSGAYLVTFIWAAHSLQQGTITYGMMLAFIQLVGQIQMPFREMTRFVPILVQALTAGERIMEMEEQPIEEDAEPAKNSEAKSPKSKVQSSEANSSEANSPKSKVQSSEANSPKSKVAKRIVQSPKSKLGFRLDNVCYSYPGDKRQVLHNVNAHFAPGQTTAIVGETGVGKTTLIRLLLGLLTPDSGSVEMYGDGWQQACSAATRSHIVYVPQGNTLLSGTVRRNLLLARPDATDEEMQQALRAACANFVLQRPEDLDTPCGEMGAGMSEGQAQRICIARSLLRHGSILLMDEATSALDEATELRLLDNLKALFGSRTIIFITHRPAVLRYCDAVVNL